jgi:uncharacterized protein YbjQ (UPF0145 family)
MIVTTTPDVQDKKVSEYLGIVFGEAIIGANIVKDIMASVRDIVGGRAAGYEKGLRTAREEALREMAMMAKERGADAVIAVDLDYEVLGASNGMRMVTASGTAVKLS